MPLTLSIKNTPEDVVDRLRRRAERNHRSLQGELMAIIEAAANEDRLSAPSEILAEIRRLGINSPEEAVDMIRADRASR